MARTISTGGTQNASLAFCHIDTITYLPYAPGPGNSRASNLRVSQLVKRDSLPDLDRSKIDKKKKKRGLGTHISHTSTPADTFRPTKLITMIANHERGKRVRSRYQSHPQFGKCVHVGRSRTKPSAPRKPIAYYPASTLRTPHGVTRYPLQVQALPPHFKYQAPGSKTAKSK